MAILSVTGLIEYLKSAFGDPLFTRIVIGIWGLPFLAILVFSAFHFGELSPDHWLIAFPIAVGALGMFLLYTAILADDKTVEKRTEFLSEGGELLGVFLVIVVVILAIPIWELLKLLRSEN